MRGTTTTRSGRVLGAMTTRAATAALVAVFVSSLLTTTVASAAGFSAQVVNNANKFSSGNVILQGTTSGSIICKSSTTTITTNAAACPGDTLPTGTLSTTASSATTTVTSLGNTAASAGVLTQTGCGVAQIGEASSANTALIFNGVTYGTTMAKLASTATTFDGTAGWAQTLNQETNPQNFTVAGYFNTTHAQGTLLGFSATQYNAGSTTNDRELWLDPAGQVVWGVRSGGGAGTRTSITSPLGYANGAWHFVAASVGAAGMQLYVDGALVASNGGVTTARNYSGYWALGWGSELSSAWTNPPANAFFNGVLSQLAVVATQLTAANVTSLYTPTTASGYATALAAFTPTDSWPMSDTGTVPYTGTVPTLSASAPTLADASGNGNTGTGQGNVTLGAAGPLGGNAITLDGATGTYVATATAYANPQNFTEGAWFKTTGSGPIMGFTTQVDDSTPSHYERMIWTDPTGHVVYNVDPPGGVGGISQVTSPGTYANGVWHYVAASIGPAGQVLYVDGVLVASTAVTVTAEVYTGYWHLGFAYTGSWPDPPTNNYFTGQLAQAAILPGQLTTSQVAALYGSANVVSFATAVLARSPTAYWPLTDTGTSSSCGLVQATISDTVTTPTCVYPAGAGACPAPAATALLSGFTSRPLPVPTTATAAAVVVTLKLTGASPAGIAGLHLVSQLSVFVQRSTFSAQLSYPTASVLL